MKFHSLRGEGKEFRSIEKLFDVKGRIRSVSIASGYIDTASIQQLLDFLEGRKDQRGCLLRIFIDEHASHYNDEKIGEELARLNKIIVDNYNKGSGIYLVRYGSIFHTKLYLVKTTKCDTFIIGSMNFTCAARERNEEVLLESRDFNTERTVSAPIYRQMEEYFESLVDDEKKVVILSEKVRDKAVKSSSLREILLQGTIFYESKESGLTSFKLELPNEIVSKSSDLTPALQDKTTDSVSLMTFFDEADFDDDVFDSGKGSWKQFCVETCYGYWCPVIFDDEVEDVLYEKFKVRAKKINRLVDLAKNNREHARRKLHAIHADINNYFVDREIPNRWKYADLVEFNARWDRWYDGLLLKFENNKFLKKLKRNVQDALVPDIWADAMASEEFEISFLESLIYEMKKRSGWNKPAQKLREDVIDKADEWEDLEDDKLIDILKAWDVDESSPSPLDVFLGMDENDDEDDEDWDDGDD